MKKGSDNTLLIFFTVLVLIHIAILVWGFAEQTP